MDANGRAEPGRLAGKVCVIAGAAGAIGEAVAERLTTEGAVVAGIDRRDHAVGALSLKADLTTTMLCCKHAIPYLLRNEPTGGSVINTSSFLAGMGAATAQSHADGPGSARSRNWPAPSPTSPATTPAS